MSALKLVKDLNYNVLSNVFKLLNPETRIGNDWKTFAGHLGLSFNVILLLEGEANPAFAAVRKWLSQDGQKTVSVLIDILKGMDRFDAVRYLEEHEFSDLPQSPPYPTSDPGTIPKDLPQSPPYPTSDPGTIPKGNKPPPGSREEVHPKISDEQPIKEPILSSSVTGNTEVLRPPMGWNVPPLIEDIETRRNSRGHGSTNSVPYPIDGRGGMPQPQQVVLNPYLIGLQHLCVKAESFSPEKLENSLIEPDDEATKDFIFPQTMYRIKDPEVSLKFYTGVLGMRLLEKIDIDSVKSTVYHMDYENKSDNPTEANARSRNATLELTHNWGSENDEDFSSDNGNSQRKGFGHIGIIVPDVEKACERFESMGVQFAKKPNEGKMKGLAFIKDPDGYLIEIFNNKIFS